MSLPVSWEGNPVINLQSDFEIYPKQWKLLILLHEPNNFIVTQWNRLKIYKIVVLLHNHPTVIKFNFVEQNLIHLSF